MGAIPNKCFTRIDLNANLRRGSICLAMFLPDHVVLNKTTHYHMRSDCSWIAEYSQMLVGIAWAMHQLCLLISCIILHNLNEFIKLLTEIGVRPFCIVHPYSIHLWTTTNNLNALKQSSIYVNTGKNKFFSRRKTINGNKNILPYMCRYIEKR